MIAEIKKIEFWNFLTTEKNQPRPKGITVHRLAMLKSAILGADELWLKIIEMSGATDRPAAEFYGSNESAAVESRAGFWDAVRKLIGGNENNGGRTNQPTLARQRTNQKSPVLPNARRKRF